MDALTKVEVELCVERIAAHQKAHGLSDVELVRRFPALGSARTWGRLAAKDFAASPVASWGAGVKKVFDEIEGRASEGANSDAPISLVTRHLAEAERCRREGHVTLARSHCRTARQAIEQFQRSLATPAAASTANARTP